MFFTIAPSVNIFLFSSRKIGSHCKTRPTSVRKQEAIKRTYASTQDEGKKAGVTTDGV